ncbi:MAG: DUF805 domain-containing protein [Pseudomonadota bacterium]|nr:DUF805 domain-containing protein [Pseudomonadota bacterium]
MNTFMQASIAGFTRCFEFGGRSSRTDFWYFMLLFILLYMVVAVVDQFLVTSTVDIRELPLGHYIPMGMVDPNVGVLVLLYRPIMAIPTIAVTIRRLHDVDKSGWWCLLWVLPVPVVGWLYLVPLLCRPSSE